MRGILFTEFAEFVEKNLGLPALQRALDEAELPSDGVYTAVGNYPYKEMEAILSRILANGPNLSAEKLLYDFGKWLAITFQEKYADFFDGHDAISFLATIDNHIHQEVRKLYPDAVPPSVILSKVSETEYILAYESHRPLATVAKGLAVGSVEAYGGKWDIQVDEAGDDSKSMMMRLTPKKG